MKSMRVWYIPIDVILVVLASCTPRGNAGNGWRGVP